MNSFWFTSYFILPKEADHFWSNKKILSQYFFLRGFQLDSFDCYEGKPESIRWHGQETQSNVLAKLEQQMLSRLATQISSSSLCSGLTEVPAGIPEDVVHIDLSFNSIRHLKAKDFQGARSLRTLNVSNNNMDHMDTGMNRPVGNNGDMLSLATDNNGGDKWKKLFFHCNHSWLFNFSAGVHPCLCLQDSQLITDRSAVIVKHQPGHYRILELPFKPWKTMPLWLLNLFKRLPVRASAPPSAGFVQQQSALHPARGSRRSLLPIYSQTGWQPLDVWLQVGSWS